jgi:hypothetical protein
MKTEQQRRRSALGQSSEGKELNIESATASYEGWMRSCPIVLAEREQKLDKLGADSFKPPSDFWGKLNRLPTVRHSLARDLKHALEKTLPDRKMEYKVVRREAGLGSLGQKRFVAIARWQGGFIAREAKSMLPSACSRLNDQIGHRQSYYEKAISSAIRSPDPFQVIEGSWLIRRLSPDSNPIDIQNLPKHRDERMLLHAMGSEAANVHLGTKGQTTKILNDLQKRKPAWLRNAAVGMARILETDWHRYRKH